MCSQLAADWCNIIVMLMFLDTKVDKKNESSNWYYINMLWHTISTTSSRMVDNIMQATENWGDTRRRSCFKTNRQIAHRSKCVTSVVNRRNRYKILAGTIAFASVAKAAPLTGQNSPAGFDSDSYLLHVDNCASRCVTNNANDFVRPPELVQGRVKRDRRSKSGRLSRGHYQVDVRRRHRTITFVPDPRIAVRTIFPSTSFITAALGTDSEG